MSKLNNKNELIEESLSEEQIKIRKLEIKKKSLMREALIKVKGLFFAVAALASMGAYIAIGPTVGYHLINPITHMMVFGASIASGFAFSTIIAGAASLLTKEARQIKKVKREIKDTEYDEYIRLNPIQESSSFDLSDDLTAGLRSGEMTEKDRLFSEYPSYTERKKMREKEELEKKTKESKDEEKLF